MGKYFADIHALPASQLGGQPHGLADTTEVASLRNAQTYEELLDLGKALCFQLRHREAVEVYTKAIALKPQDIRGYRQRAARYLTTLRPEPAIRDFLRCQELGGDEQDLSYRLGLCRYYAGDYEGAMLELERCYPLCDEEMGIAAIFWHTLSAWRAGEQPALLAQCYHPGMKVGHHTAYDFAMAVASGAHSLEEAKQRINGETDDLEYGIMAYGIAACLSALGRDAEARTILNQLLERDGFWISYAYLAAWNDTHREHTD